MTATTPSTYSRGAAGANPVDTVLSSATRFGVELVAWVAGPLAVYAISGSPVLAIASLVVLVAAPALFNTPGDKRHEGPVSTPGPMRFALEVVLLLVAVLATAVVWPVPVLVLVIALATACVFSGIPRARWLLSGAESRSSAPTAHC